LLSGCCADIAHLRCSIKITATGGGSIRWRVAESGARSKANQLGKVRRGDRGSIRVFLHSAAASHRAKNRRLSARRRIGASTYRDITALPALHLAGMLFRYLFCARRKQRGSGEQWYKVCRSGRMDISARRRYEKWRISVAKISAIR
jgi:hypothetical protein